MKTFARFLFAGLLSAAPLAAAAPRADVLPAARRQTSVDTAVRLTQPPVPAPVPPDLKHPFDPSDFTAADPESGTPAAPRTAEAGPAQPARPAGAREVLETIAARIQPTGSIVVRGRSLLTFSGRTPTVGVGQSFVVTYEEQDHELEVVAIDRTTFTLRYRGEEITRPIKPSR